MEKVLIGTTNQGKLSDWRVKLQGFNLLSLKDLGIDFDVEEDMVSLENNSKKKARAYAKESGLVTLSEDIGFFIKELGGRPGVAVKRWAGELSEDVTEEEFLDFFKKKISAIEDTSSYFLTMVSIASPNGEIKTVCNRTDGYIEKGKFDCENIEGYPLSKVFIRNGRGKTWAEMSDEEKLEDEKDIANKVRKSLEEIFG